MATGTCERCSKPRRRFLRKAALAAGALTLAGIANRFGLSLFSGQTGIWPESQPPDERARIFSDVRLKDLVASEITDTKDFSNIEISSNPARVDLNEWLLRIRDRVDTPISLDINNLMRQPAKSEYYTLECVYFHVEPPMEFMVTFEWTGIPLSKLLEEAKPAPNAQYVVFRGADGYDVGIPISRAMHPATMLAYRVNGEILPHEHGFPLRAIVPGMHGQMNPKRITEIEVVDDEYVGYWQRMEQWSNDLVVKTTSVIRYPEDYTSVAERTPIAGFAFAGDRGISKVEISVDGGHTWSEATLKKPLSPYTWVLWGYEWTPRVRGLYTIVVRAYDGSGEVQDSRIARAWPAGASGYHSIHVMAE